MRRKRGVLTQEPPSETAPVYRARRLWVTFHYECHDALTPVWSTDHAILWNRDKDCGYWTQGKCLLCQLIAYYGSEGEEQV